MCCVIYDLKWENFKIKNHQQNHLLHQAIIFFLRVFFGSFFMWLLQFFSRQRNQKKKRDSAEPQHFWNCFLFMKINSTLVRQQVFLLFSRMVVLLSAQCARCVRTNATYFTNIINKLVFYYSTLLGEIVVDGWWWWNRTKKSTAGRHANDDENEKWICVRVRVEKRNAVTAVAVWVRDRFKPVKQTKTIYKQIGWHKQRDDMVNKANSIHLTR